MSSTQFWVGMLVPPIIKWVNPRLKNFFKLNEFDVQTKERVASKQYPLYYSFLYTLWVLILLGTGILELLLMMIYGMEIFPGKNFAAIIFLGLINMIGVWFIFGAILDALFWQISPKNFKDYVIFKQLKSGWGYDIKQQVAILISIKTHYQGRFNLVRLRTNLLPVSDINITSNINRILSAFENTIQVEILRVRWEEIKRLRFVQN